MEEVQKKLKKEIKSILSILDDIKTTQNQISCNIFVKTSDKFLNKIYTHTKEKHPKTKISHKSEKLKQEIDKQEYKLHKNLINQYRNLLDVAINLNKLLEKPIKSVSKNEERKHKLILTTKDVEELYSMSRDTQKSLRYRPNNPLPYKKDPTTSKSLNTKIYYKKSELDDWIENFF